MYREQEDVLPVTTIIEHPCLKQWRERIDWAEHCGGFNVGYKQAAARWDMCAIGEAREKYHIATGGKLHKPVDSRLKRLGLDFSHAVDDDDFRECRVIITAIEQRLAELR